MESHSRKPLQCIFLSEGEDRRCRTGSSRRSQSIYLFCCKSSHVGIEGRIHLMQWFPTSGFHTRLLGFSQWKRRSSRSSLLSLTSLLILRKLENRKENPHMLKKKKKKEWNEKQCLFRLMGCSLVFLERYHFMFCLWVIQTRNGFPFILTFQVTTQI